jgi:hypothetical protein
MSFKLLLCLALVLSGAMCGCSTTRPLAVIAPEKERHPELPVKFASYRQLYEFMATREGVQSFPDAVFKLAADSETQIYSLDEPPKYVWVITPRFYNGGIYDVIRGAQGNGSIYLVRPLARDFISANTDCGFELVGLAEGNIYRLSNVNKTPILITHWHLSADKDPETVYEWNGKFFVHVRPDKSGSNP